MVKAATDVSYMYLAGMENPSYRTIARFKVEYPDLINEAFKTKHEIARIHHNRPQIIQTLNSYYTQSIQLKKNMQRNK